MKEQNKTKKLNIKTILHKGISLILVIMCVASLTACMGISGKKGEKIVWTDLILGDKLPKLSDVKGEIQYNNTEMLDLDIHDISESGFNRYIEACKEKGFATDAETAYNSFTAYNTEGYKLYLYYYSSSSELQIDLDSPMELSTIIWPTGTAGKLLPVPKSNVGKFNYEYDDHFSVYIGNTSKEEFWEYVTTCSNAGFNIDYDKGEDYYSAYDADGWKIRLDYEGFNIICIDINEPEEETVAPTTVPVTEKATEAPIEKTTEKAVQKATEKKESNSSGLDPDFKAAMDSYEEFMNDYVAFMKKYNANPNDLTLITDYLDYLSEYSDMVEEFEKWEDEDLNDEELSYYLEVQTRVTQKLLEVN